MTYHIIIDLGVANIIISYHLSEKPIESISYHFFIIFKVLDFVISYHLGFSHIAQLWPIDTPMISGFQNCINDFSRFSQCGEHLGEHRIFIYREINRSDFKQRFVYRSNIF